MPEILQTPDFKSEKEEAEWWDSAEGRAAILKGFQDAQRDGTLGRGTLKKAGWLDTNHDHTTRPAGHRAGKDPGGEARPEVPDVPEEPHPSGPSPGSWSVKTASLRADKQQVPPLRFASVEITNERLTTSFVILSGARSA